MECQEKEEWVQNEREEIYAAIGKEFLAEKVGRPRE